MKPSGEISAAQFPGRGVLGVDPLQFRPVVVCESEAMAHNKLPIAVARSPFL
jgi:hypothetical protein